VLGSNDRYLRQRPDSVQSGSIKVATVADPSVPTLVYATENGGRGYRIEVHVPKQATCVLRGGDAATTPAIRSCSSR
jgi:hypothetical protein